MIGLFDFVVAILTIIVIVLTYFKWKFAYWRNRNVPYIQPKIPFGTSENPFRRTRNPALTVQEQYNHLKSLGHKFGGIYLLTRPTLLLVDTELIKNVMTKDFQYFCDRGIYHDEKSDPLSGHLFNAEGLKWRHLRTKLTPTFTSGKIKMMLSTLLACGDPLKFALNEFAERKQSIDIKDVLARFTTDVIGSCAFGLECNSFKEPDSEFRKYSKMIFSFSSKLDSVKGLIAFSNPSLAKRLHISLMHPESKRFFLEVVRNTVEYRTNNNVVRNDFMQLLIDLKNENGIDECLTVDQMAAQAFVFFFAGFDTSSTTMAFCLYELATDPNIQNKIRDEINTVLIKYNGNITYDAIMDMKYLSQVTEEALRKYPSGILLPRVCAQNYQIPDTDIIIEKGTRVLLPIYALHHDPEYFPDPENFDPERFNENNRTNIRPFTYIPFGEGPRNCIGMRFGLLLTKVGLIISLRSFKFSINSKTQLPLKFNRVNFILAAEGVIWLDIEKVPETDI